MPEIETHAYSAGKIAGLLSKPIANCRHPRYSDKWHEWIAGHSAAQFNRRYFK